MLPLALRPSWRRVNNSDFSGRIDPDHISIKSITPENTGSVIAEIRSGFFVWEKIWTGIKKHPGNISGTPVKINRVIKEIILMRPVVVFCFC
jgi:hypothetical protein